MDWTKQKIQKYPELIYLADQAVRKTEQDNETKLGNSPSEILYGQKYVEFDRSILSLMALNWIYDGSPDSYEAMTHDQPLQDKLSHEDFLSLHHRFKEMISSPSDLQDFEIALVLGDMGKTKYFRDKFAPLNVNASDHDDFLKEALQKNPLLFPSFSQLSPWAQKILPQVSGIIHFGHVTHLEGGIEMFEPLVNSRIAIHHPKALEFDFLVHLADVAGSMGHVNPTSSLVLTDKTYNALMAVDKTLSILKKDGNSLIALRHYIAIRAKWLGVSADTTEGRMITRLGAMMRLFTKDEGMILTQMIQKFTPKKQNIFASKLDPLSPTLPSITPTYIPAVFVNLLNNKELSESREMRLQKSLEIGVPFITRVLIEYKKRFDEKRIEHPTAPLNFNDIARIAKESPTKIDPNSFSIDSDNIVKFS